MGLYGRQYIAHVRRAPGTGHLVIATAGLIGRHETTYAAAEVTIGTVHASRPIDDAFGTGIRVHAPWQAVRVPDRRLPLILDGQGWFSPRHDAKG
jgi:hypothetical protein